VPLKKSRLDGRLFLLEAGPEGKRKKEKGKRVNI